MNGAKICQQTTKSRQILEMTSYDFVTFYPSSIFNLKILSLLRS